MTQSPRNFVSRWRERIVQLALLVLVAYLVIRGLAPSTQNSYMDRFTDAALGATVLIVLRLVADLRLSSRSLKESVDRMGGDAASFALTAEEHHEELLAVLREAGSDGITRFQNPGEFFDALCRDTQAAQTSRYYGTSIRVQSTSEYGPQGKRHYDTVFDRCKDDSGFCATRIVGVANKAMLDWALENVKRARNNSRLSVRVIPWRQRFSMINMALLGNTAEIHKVYLALTVARAPDTFGFCIENHPHIAAYFKQYFDHIYAEADDPIRNPNALSQLASEIEEA